MADLSVADLGRAIKQKVPGKYDSYPDAQLGAAAKAKFPQYKDFKDVTTAGSGKTGARLKGDTKDTLGSMLLEQATALMMGGPILGEAAAIPGVARAARSIKAGSEGAAQGLKEGFSAPPSKRGAAIGATLGGAAGYKVAHYPGALIGGGAGATIGGELGNIAPALRRAVELGKLRVRQANLPARGAPAWKGVPESGSNVVEFQPIKQTATPSGRSPGKVPDPAAGPGKPAASAARQPLWKDIPEPTPRKLPEVKPITPKGKLSPKAELKPPATPTESKAPFEPNAAKRETVARDITLAKVLHEGGITAKQAESEMDIEHWTYLAKEIGLKVPSKANIPTILKEIERLEQATPAVAKNPQAFQAAEQLRNEMQRSGTIPSPAHRLNPPEGPGG